MSLELVRFYRSEAEGPQNMLLGSFLVSGVSRGLLIAVVNASVEKSVNGESLLSSIFLFVAVLALYLGCHYFAKTTTYAMVGMMTQKLRLRLVNKLLFADLGFIESEGDNKIYARLTQEINILAQAGIILVGTFENAVLLFFSLIYIGWLSPIALFVTTCVVMSGMYFYVRQQRSAKNNVRRVREKEVEFFGAINDFLCGFKELKLNRKKNNAVNDHVANVSDIYRDLTYKTERMFVVSFLTTETFVFMLMAALVFVVPQFFDAGSVIIFQFLAALLFLIGPLDAVVSAVPRLIHANVALENVRELELKADQSTAVDENLSRDIKALELHKIELKALTFVYHGKQSDDAFSVGPIDFSLQQGEVVFIVGGNGSGKTTLVKLLAGLYLPSGGELRINGKPLAIHDYQAYREMFSAIFGDFHLFKRLYGMEDLNQAVLHDLLAKMHLDTKTHFDGEGFTAVNLSTGQRKRLAYVTSYLENKQIFVFDEFAADQDPSFRQLFYRTLLPELKRQGKTIIAISHDDNYFDACDRIVKVDYGRIAYDGPPEGLH
ncbi:MAG TPA: cyclic peptide export ABC transporter [Gammaproteobacteria bacterium]|nr:cyclic peptide export ABC transporter [Gammaproteobacteria bacterium]